MIVLRVWIVCSYGAVLMAAGVVRKFLPETAVAA